MNKGFGVFWLFLLALMVLSFSMKNKTPKKYVDRRDGEIYRTTTIGNLRWMKENLRFQTGTSLDPSDYRNVDKDCGIFYSFEESKKVCPKGWRLPTDLEMKHLVHLDSIKRINLLKELDISLCGNSDRGALTMIGSEAAFWVDANMKDEQVEHWHMYKTDHVVHSHNVDQVNRMYPVRCVCELEQ